MEREISIYEKIKTDSGEEVVSKSVLHHDDGTPVTQIVMQRQYLVKWLGLSYKQVY